MRSIFPDGLIDPAHRPGWIVNVTNDGWFGRTSGPYQHLAQVRLRAIEQGLAGRSGRLIPEFQPWSIPMAASCNRLALGERGVLDSGLPRALPPTFYSRWGDLILVVIIGIAIVLVVALSLAARRSR